MQVETGDTPARSAAEFARLIPADEERGTPVALHEPRGHDADDAGMPRVGAEDDGGVGWLERLLHNLDGLVENQLIHLLAPRVDRLELARECGRFLRVFGEQEPQAVVRVADPAYSIETGRENEADVRAAQRLAGEARGLDQSAEPDPT